MSENLAIYGNEGTRSKLLSFYKRTLATWPVLYEELLVQTPYGDTHVIASGSKQTAATLVLIHAAGANATMWSPNVAAFSSSYCVYALYTMGDLGKGVLKDPNYYPKTALDYANWVSDVLDGLGIRQAYVMGSSMGGWITHSAALFTPERIMSA